jgi:dTDP-4-amino-4,6-dideoxygalactose transaminase
MSILAINGGPKVRKNLFPYQTSFGVEEKEAVNRVLNKGILSGYRGSWNDAFYGSTEVRNFEKEWAEKFNARYAIACNSCTSALFIACKAIGLQQGDEVIVTSYSMSCSATIPIACGATPVFADLEPDNFCLSPESCEKYITKNTKAIIAVSIFGNPIDYEGFKRLKEKYGVYIIEDAAQSVGAKYGNLYSGSLGDISCFSFTQGKHLSCGEGGILTTNDPKLAFECRLFMNHRDSVHNDIVIKNDLIALRDMDTRNNYEAGFNLRMTEISAAIMREQLKKIDFILETKRKNCEYIAHEFSRFDGITPASPRKNCVHSYYVQPFLFDEKVVGVSRSKFISAFMAELMPEQGRDVEGVGILVGSGYITPIYRWPIFSNRGFKPENYPVVEDLWKNKLFILRMSAPPISIEDDLVDVVLAFDKVYHNKLEIK